MEELRFEIVKKTMWLVMSIVVALFFVNSAYHFISIAHIALSILAIASTLGIYAVMINICLQIKWAKEKFAYLESCDSVPSEELMQISDHLHKI